jgi:hypothetical protein
MISDRFRADEHFSFPFLGLRAARAPDALDRTRNLLHASGDLRALDVPGHER